VSLEATHHGPTDIKVPSLFVEIGSSEGEWDNEQAGKIVAQAILACDMPPEMSVAIGLGGTHYPKRQTVLTLNERVCFGHILTTRVLEGLSEGGDAEEKLASMISLAAKQTGAMLAYIDRKALPSSLRKLIEKVLDDIGLPLLGESEMHALWVLSLDCYLYLREKLGKVKVPDQLISAYRDMEPVDNPSNLWYVYMPTELWELLRKKYLDRLKKGCKDGKLMYVEENGSPMSILIGTSVDTEHEARAMLEEIIAGIDGAELSGEEVIFYERYMDMEKVDALGIKGKQIGALRKGEIIMIDGKTIKPEMVYAF
ncbi:MAG: D-aminoacyl-tRNA deacylase, partial [Methermicoccaceae archaeon]